MPPAHVTSESTHRRPTQVLVSLQGMPEHDGSSKIGNVMRVRSTNENLRRAMMQPAGKDVFVHWSVVKPPKAATTTTAPWSPLGVTTRVPTERGEVLSSQFVVSAEAKRGPSPKNAARVSAERGSLATTIETPFISEHTTLVRMSSVT